MTAVLFLLAFCVAAPSWAAEAVIEWTEKSDFEGPEILYSNIDITTQHGDVMIGLTREIPKTSVIDYAGGKTYSIGIERQAVAVQDADGLTRMIPLPGQPAGLVYNTSNNRIYVGKYESNIVWVIDPDASYATPESIPTIVLAEGTYAYPVAVNADGTKVYVANLAAKKVAIIDCGTGEVANVDVVGSPYTATFRNGNLYITSRYNNSISVINGSTNVVVTHKIDPVVAKLEGLKATAPVGTSTSDRIYLMWNYNALQEPQNIEFQVRTANNLADLVGVAYTGPSGPDSWYNASHGEVSGASDGLSAKVLIKTGFAGAAGLRFRLTSDEASTPVLHSVALVYESLPDLVVTNVEAPSAPFIGRPVSISSTVLNQGTIPAGSSFKVGHTLTDANGAVHFLTECDRTVLSLAPGLSDTGTGTCVIPSTTAEGPAQLKVCADAAFQVAEGPAEANNCATIIVNPVRPFPDLRPATPLVVDPPKVKPAGSYTVSSNILNEGNDAAGSFNVAVTLIDAAGNRTSAGCSNGSIASLAAGGSVPVSLSCVAPSVDGFYDVELCADSPSAINEGSAENENDNCVTAGDALEVARPDLAISSFTKDRETVSPGDVINVTDTVCNVGKEAARDSISGYYIIDSNGVRSERLASRPVPTLAVAECHTGTTAITVPSNIAEGSYCIEAVADDDPKVVDESNESNNTLPVCSGKVLKFYIPGQDILISKNASGVIGNGSSGTPTIIGNGRYLAFSSTATNLVTSDTNGSGPDIFIHDRQTATNELLKVGYDGNLQPAQCNGPHGWPSFSDDGQLVVLNSSYAPGGNCSNLDPDYPGPVGIFLHKRMDGKTKLITKDPNGTAPYSGSRTTGGYISGDGRFILYSSNAYNMLQQTYGVGLTDQVFLYDVASDRSEIISKTGTENGNGVSLPSSINGDGRYIVFNSMASNLVPGDTNGVEDVFVYDRELRVIERISVATDGTQGNGRSNLGKISHDGRYVTFQSTASNFVSGDTNGVDDVFVYDRQNKSLKLISKTVNGGTGNKASAPVSISGNGRFVFINSAATDLIPYTTGYSQVYKSFIYDLETDRLEIPFFCADGSQSSCTTNTEAAGLSLDGSFFSFSRIDGYNSQAFLQMRGLGPKNPLFAADIATVMGVSATEGGPAINVPRGGEVTVTAADTGSPGGAIYNWLTSNGTFIGSGKSAIYPLDTFNTVGASSLTLAVVDYTRTVSTVSQPVNVIEHFSFQSVSTSATGYSTIRGTFNFPYSSFTVYWGDGRSNGYSNLGTSVNFTHKYTRTDPDPHSVPDADPNIPGDQPGYKYDVKVRTLKTGSVVGETTFPIYILK